MYLNFSKFSLGLAIIGSLVSHVKADDFHELAKPFMQEFCYKCHSADKKIKGDLDLTDFSMAKSLIKDADIWRDILEQVETEEMPTKDPLPSSEERAKFVKWLKGELNSVDWTKVKHAGHVSMPLLTKREYNNTIRDLLGVDVQAGYILFDDGEGHSGFTTDRSNLFLSPASIEKYFSAADKALDAIASNERPISKMVQAEAMLSTSKMVSATMQGGKGIRLSAGQTTLYDSITVPRDGFYIIELRGKSANADNGTAILRLDNRVVGTVSFLGAGSSTQSVRVFISEGSHQLAVNKGFGGGATNTKKGKIFRKEVVIDWVKLSGPTAPKGRSIYPMKVQSGMSEIDSAKSVLSHFLLRAFRRPVNGGVVAKYINVFRIVRSSGESYTQSLRQAMLAALVSPRFLYRDELAPIGVKTDSEFALDQFQVASRLSYFLWLSMPDKELFKLAAEGKLKDPTVLRAQVKRMLADPKSREFTSSFLGQWLGFESLGSEVVPDAKVFPKFNSELAEAMKRETILTFEHLIKNDLTILHLLDTKATYLNEALADHYGIKGVKGDKMRAVFLKDRNRGGLLGMASILTSTSSPTRTSPVLRGKWVMETLLGEHIPEAPADVPEINAKAGMRKNFTLRQELEMHREKAECARCHDKIDPIGFGLENFDAIGRFRTKELTGKAIDSSGELHGHKFQGIDQLKKYLMNYHKEQFTHTVSEKMLTFAIGRKIETFDQAAMLKISKALKEDDYKLTTLIEEVVLSYPFLHQSSTNEINIHE